MIDGGPAFPACIGKDGTGVHIFCSGMTLRQWYAGMALMGYWAGRKQDAGTYNLRIIAGDLLKMADAMLEEDGKK